MILGSHGFGISYVQQLIGYRQYGCLFMPCNTNHEILPRRTSLDPMQRHHELPRFILSSSKYLIGYQTTTNFDQVANMTNIEDLEANAASASVSNLSNPAPQPVCPLLFATSPI
jgi:hypothetical protein